MLCAPISYSQQPEAPARLLGCVLFEFTTDAHLYPTLVEGNCALSLFAHLMTTRLYSNEVIQRDYTGMRLNNDDIQESQLVYGDHTEHLNIDILFATPSRIFRRRAVCRKKKKLNLT